nr:metallopeptidase, catalytic domain-containing protein [Tanacetum cinerariifolium]
MKERDTISSKISEREGGEASNIVRFRSFHKNHQATQKTPSNTRLTFEKNRTLENHTFQSEKEDHGCQSRAHQRQTRRITAISFQKLNHGDGGDFDGPNGTLAHAFSPPDGRLHFDADETWSLGPGPVPNVIDFKSVALHEIGHLLGLGHSQYEDAVMWESLPFGTVKDKLTLDDIQGIKALYGLN